jgi:hypothetical protein
MGDIRHPNIILDIILNDIQDRYPKKSEYPPNTGTNPTLDMLWLNWFVKILSYS